MIHRSTISAIGRAANAVFFLMTAAYCILNYSAFAYYQFLRPEVLAWPSDFVALHHVFFLLVWLITALTLLPHVRGPRRSIAAIAYLGISALAGVSLIIHPLMTTMDNSSRSLVFGLIALLFPLTLALVDHTLAPARPIAVVNQRRLLRSCARAREATR